MTLPRNSILSTDRSGWYKLDPPEYSATDPLDPTWSYFSSFAEALQQLQFDPYDLVNYIDTSGFYHPTMRVRAGLFVYGPGYTLLKDHKDTYTYPVNGWVWKDSVQDASDHFDIPIKDFNLDLY